MKGLLLMLLCGLCCMIDSYAETITKHEIVVDTDRFQGEWYQGPRPRVTNYTLMVVTDYNDNMEIIDAPRFGLVVHDDNYDFSDETFTLYLGSASELLSLIDKSIDFLSKTEKGTSTKYNGYELLVLNGKINIKNENERAYHVFKDKELKNIKKKLSEYCEKKGYSLE